MPSKGQRLTALYAEHHSSVSVPVSNNSQETHSRKLQADTSRTETFIRQADDAIEQLTKTLGSLAEHGAHVDPAHLPSGWDAETCKSARLLALHEVYRQLPFTPMKNDSIGIATAVKMTSDAVIEQRETSDLLAAQNDAFYSETRELKAILRDYEELQPELAMRVSKFPQKLAKLEQKIRESGSYPEEVDRRLGSVSQELSAAKEAEERMYGHLQRVVMKLHALVDWENANMMDEATFRKSITASVSLMKTMVQKLAENGGNSDANWVAVPEEMAGARLIEVMIRSNVVMVRESNSRLEIKLLDLGQ